MTAGGVIEAKYPGRCAECGALIEPGDAIRYYPASGDFEAVTKCAVCPTVEPPRRRERPTGEEIWDHRTCGGCGYHFAYWRSKGGLGDRCEACGSGWEEAA